MDRRSALFGTASLALTAFGSGTAVATGNVGWPVPPCAGQVVPAYPPLGAPPAVALWHDPGPEGGWMPPACTGWYPREDTVLVAVAGRFAFKGSIDQIMTRLGAVSAQAAIRFWSVEDQAWKPMFEDVAALAAPDHDQRRADFTSAELVPKTPLYVLYDDTDLSAAVYELTVVERSDRSATVRLRNIEPGRSMGITIIGEGCFELTITVAAEGDGVWTYYALNRSGPLLMQSLMPAEGTLINRAVALYRFLLGVPTDRDPPLVSS